MKRPNLAWRNHCIFSSCDLGTGRGLAPGCARAAPSERKARPMFNDKIWEIPRFIGSLLGDPLFPHKTARNSSEEDGFNAETRYWADQNMRARRQHKSEMGAGRWNGRNSLQC